MSTDSSPKIHEIEGLSRLSIVYLRVALNKTDWLSASTPIEDYGRGVDALKALPNVYIPKELVRDEDVLSWGNDMMWAPITISEAVRDTCRTALKKAFEMRVFQVNDHSYALITKFALK